jgi:hypothetical protein
METTEGAHQVVVEEEQLASEGHDEAHRVRAPRTYDKK